MPTVDAVVTAGGIPKPGDPLYADTQGKSKALLEIAGRPMIQWVLDALSGARTIRRVVVVGLSDQVALHCVKPLSFLPNQGSMLANLEAGVRWVLDQDAGTPYALLVSSDIPTITPAAVDWVIETSLQTDHEVYYSVIPQAAMEQRFPGSKRSYFRFKDGTFTGGDLTLVATQVITHVPPAIKDLIEARKNVFQQAAIIGLDTLFRFATRQLAVADVERVCRQRLGVRGRALVCPHAEAGMDVDKPAQYELVRRDLESRQVSA
jgi:CTP:molybdopterin cytidylyltransferase MocA